jgi:hypothetical protein
VPSICAGLVGLGIGLTTPAHMVAVQNSVGEERLGAATSTTQFTRKIGSTMGVAIAGGLFTATTASRLRATGALGEDEPISSLLESPSRIDGFPDQLEATVRSAVASGSVAVFALTFVAAATAFVLSFRLPDERLGDEIASGGAGVAASPPLNNSSSPDSS